MPTPRQGHAKHRSRSDSVVDQGDTADAARLDKWLWAARFFKTRALAQAAIESGRVRSDGSEGSRLKPSHTVRPGHRYSVVRDGLTWNIEVLGIADRRGPASVAQALYREDEASIAERQRIIALNHAAGPTLFKGRPTKRQRRKIEDFLAEP